MEYGSLIPRQQNKGGTRQKGAVTDDGPKHAKGDDGGRRPWRRRLIVMGAVAPGGAKASEGAS